MIKKAMFAAVGMLGVLPGILFATFPIIPATPFLFFAGACFEQSHPSLHQKLMQTELYIRHVNACKVSMSMSWQTKILLMAALAAVIFIGCAAMHHLVLGQIILLIVGLLHMVCFMFCMKSPAKTAAQNTQG